MRIRQTERALRLAETLGGKGGLNCVAELDPTALAQAEAQAARTGEALPLPGVPILVKDNVDVRGLHTTAGSLALADNLARADAPVIRRLRENGAVILGKTNMTEFANYTTDGMPGGYSSRGGQVIHAADPALSPSGSSSGSAVAVAAGIVPMAVGTDTSFSVTACAKANGICGLKPPAGALSAEGIVPIARTLDSAGAMAASFADALKLYSAMREEPLPSVEPLPPAGLRIAVNRANWDRLPEEEKDLHRRLIDRLRAEGAAVGELLQPPVPQVATIMKWEFRPMLEDYLRRSSAARKTLAEIVEYYESHPETMMKYGDACLRAALDETPGGLTGKPYLEALEARREAIPRVRAELAACDAVLMTGPTNVMHFCGLPSVTVAGGPKTAHGVSRAVILYGTEERRLYGVALTVEGIMTRRTSGD